MKLNRKWLLFFLVLSILTFNSTTVFATTTDGIVNLNMGGDWSENVNSIVFLTLLMLGPSILACVTAFPRYAISLSFLRQSLGVQQIPPNQILLGLAFFMTMFTMMPTFDRIYNEAYTPYVENQIESKQMFSQSVDITKEFMLKNTREKDLILFAKEANLETLPDSRQDLDIRIVAPAYIISELTKSFWIGFLLYAAFIAIDLTVATVLMSMGMVMLPPMTISILIKLLIFLSADGWFMLVSKLMDSFPK